MKRRPFPLRSKKDDSPADAALRFPTDEPPSPPRACCKSTSVSNSRGVLRRGRWRNFRERRTLVKGRGGLPSFGPLVSPFPGEAYLLRCSRGTLAHAETHFRHADTFDRGDTSARRILIRNFPYCEAPSCMCAWLRERELVEKRGADRAPVLAPRFDRFKRGDEDKDRGHRGAGTIAVSSWWSFDLAGLCVIFVGGSLDEICAISSTDPGLGHVHGCGR